MARPHCILKIMSPKKNKKQNTKKRKVKGKQQKRFSLTFWCLKWSFFGLIWGCLAFTAIAAWYGADLPERVAQAKFERQPAITLFDDNGVQLTRYGQ